MPSADAFEAPQGHPLHGVMLRAITEGLAGNGILNNGDLEVTATANALELNVAGGTVYYVASEYNTAGGTLQLSQGDATYDRWDTVYFDTGTSSIGVHEGTPAQYPEPPDIAGGELLLAVVYVAQDATDVTDSDILNWRAKFSNEAEEVHFNDSTGAYGVNDVEAALDTIDLDWARGRDNTISGVLATLGANPGSFGAIVDSVVDGNSAAGTAHSYSFQLDATTFLEIYAESDGAGGIQNARADLLQTTRLGGDLVTTGGTTIWDSTNGVVPQAQLGGPASSLTSYPLPIGDLNTPYGLPNVTDMDAAGTDITDSTAGVTIWDATNEQVPRAQVDDEQATHTETASGTNGSYVTSDEEVILVDTATNATGFTVTLASADANAGNHILVGDYGGSAGNYPITVDTEGTETIDGASSVPVDKDWGAALFVSDGTNWYQVGASGLDVGVIVENSGTTVLNPAEGIDFANGLGVTDNGDETVTVDYEHQQVFEGRESGSISSGNQGILIIDHLADGETATLYKAALTNADGTAAPTGCDLELVTMDNAGGFTSQDVVISGDGATVFDDETGNPLSTYTNTSGGGQTIAVIVDNQSGGAVTIMASCEGVTG